MPKFQQYDVFEWTPCRIRHSVADSALRLKLCLIAKGLLLSRNFNIAEMNVNLCSRRFPEIKGAATNASRLQAVTKTFARIQRFHAASFASTADDDRIIGHFRPVNRRCLRMDELLTPASSGRDTGERVMITKLRDQKNAKPSALAISPLPNDSFSSPIWCRGLDVVRTCCTHVEPPVYTATMFNILSPRPTLSRH